MRRDILFLYVWSSSLGKWLPYNLIKADKCHKYKMLIAACSKASLQHSWPYNKYNPDRSSMCTPVYIPSQPLQLTPFL